MDERVEFGWSAFSPHRRILMPATVVERHFGPPNATDYGYASRSAAQPLGRPRCDYSRRVKMRIKPMPDDPAREYFVSETLIFDEDTDSSDLIVETGYRKHGGEK